MYPATKLIIENDLKRPTIDEERLQDLMEFAASQKDLCGFSLDEQAAYNYIDPDSDTVLDLN